MGEIDMGRLSMGRSPHRRALLLVAALALGLAAAPAAQAFQFQNADGSGAGAPRNFLDLGKTPAATDKPGSKFSADKTTFGDGNFSMQFGGERSFHQRYDFNSQFDRYSPGPR